MDNILVLQKDELREVLSEVLEEFFGDIRKVQQEMSSKTEEDEYLTRDEVCKRLHISTTTLWRLENEGTITSHKMGRRNLYVKKEIDAIMSSKMESGANNPNSFSVFCRKMSV